MFQPFPTLVLSKSGLMGRSSITSSQPAIQAPQAFYQSILVLYHNNDKRK